MNTQNTINVLIQVVDNYGDMWTAFEYMEAHQKYANMPIVWHIWTNAVDIVQKFAKKAFPDISAEICPIEKYQTEAKTPVTISFLHASPKMQIFAYKKTLTLHIGYLSFVQGISGRDEHIFSTDAHQILVFTPSPCNNVGIIPPCAPLLSRQEILSIIGVPASVSGTWVTCFLYPETIKSIDWKSFPKDVQIFMLGNTDTRIEHANVHYISLVPHRVYYSLLAASQWAIVRWDTSLAQMMHLQTPFYPDIYRALWWYPREHVQELYTYMNATKAYQDVHSRLHTTDTPITYTQLQDGFLDMSFRFSGMANLCYEVKKHIDRFYFSL